MLLGTDKLMYGNSGYLAEEAFTPNPYEKVGPIGKDPFDPDSYLVDVEGDVNIPGFPVEFPISATKESVSGNDPDPDILPEKLILGLTRKELTIIAATAILTFFVIKIFKN
ncbi:MAG: hypothetical protein K9H26_10730 [Prolixibacteraceae bacterium]|nr:hypothetical protein [Prolixibacteraceae bacterium]